MHSFGGGIKRSLRPAAVALSGIVSTNSSSIFSTCTPTEPVPFADKALLMEQVKKTGMCTKDASQLNAVVAAAALISPWMSYPKLQNVCGDFSRSPGGAWAKNTPVSLKSLKTLSNSFGVMYRGDIEPRSPKKIRKFLNSQAQKETISDVPAPGILGAKLFHSSRTALDGFKCSSDENPLSSELFAEKKAAIFASIMDAIEKSPQNVTAYFDTLLNVTASPDFCIRRALDINVKQLASNFSEMLGLASIGATITPASPAAPPATTDGSPAHATLAQATHATSGAASSLIMAAPAPVFTFGSMGGVPLTPIHLTMPPTPSDGAVLASSFAPTPDLPMLIDPAMFNAAIATAYAQGAAQGVAQMAQTAQMSGSSKTSPESKELFKKTYAELAENTAKMKELEKQIKSTKEAATEAKDAANEANSTGNRIFANTSSISRSCANAANMAAETKDMVAKANETLAEVCADGKETKAMAAEGLAVGKDVLAKSNVMAKAIIEQNTISKAQLEQQKAQLEMQKAQLDTITGLSASSDQTLDLLKLMMEDQAPAPLPVPEPPVATTVAPTAARGLGASSSSSTNRASSSTNSVGFGSATPRFSSQPGGAKKRVGTK